MTALTAHVLNFVPDATPEDLLVRLKLLTARDYASQLLTQVESDAGYSQLCDAHHVAGSFVYADVSVARLTLALSYCRHMVMAAYAAEHLNSDGGAA